MLILKKLFFTLPFLLFFYWFNFQLTPFFKDLYLIFSFNMDILVKLILLVASLLLSCLFFVIFSTLADDWRIILPVSVVGAFAGILLFTPPSGYILTVGFLVVFIMSYFLLSNKLKTYITFQANSLLNPSIKSLATLIILVTSAVFYLSADTKIQTEGFQIPDYLIEASLKFAAPPQVQGIKISQVPSLTPEQLDSSVLESVGKAQQTSQSTTKKSSGLNPQTQSQSSEALKKLLKNQIYNMIKPYLKYIPIILAVLFFVTLQSLFSFFSILLPILVGGIFWILEKSNFVHFETETREVKKLVV